MASHNRPHRSGKPHKLHSLKSVASSSWQQQLELAARALKDPEWYRREVAHDRTELEDYTSKRLNRLRDLGALERPAIGKDPIQLLRHPAGYSAHAPRLLRLMALQLHELTIAPIFSVFVTDVPLLVLDPVGAGIYADLEARGVGGPALLREVVRRRIAAQAGGSPEALQVVPERLEDALDYGQVVRASSTLDWCLQHRGHPQTCGLKWGTWSCYPVVPRKLILEGFTMGRAGFLCE